MLFHVLVILLFGDTGTGVQGGKRLWSAMTVSLQQMLPGDDGGGTLTRTAPRITQREAARPVRRPLDIPSPTTAAAEARAIDAAAPPTESSAPPPEETPSAPAPAPTQITPRFIAKETPEPTSTFVVPPPSTIEETAKTAPVVPAPVEPQVVAAPKLEPIAPLTPLAAPKAQADVAIPSQLKLREQREALPALAPVTPMATTPNERAYVPRSETLPKLAPLAAPVPTAEIGKIEQSFTAPVAPLPTLAPIAAPAATSMVPAKIERELMTPNLPLPKLAPVTALPATNVAPNKIDREFVPPAVEAVPVAPTRDAPAATAQPDARAARTPASEARTAPDVASTPSASPSARSGDGGNSEEDGLSRDRPRIPSAPGSPSNKPDLSLDTLRQRARDLAAQGTGPRTVLPFPTSPKPPPKTKAQQAFDKALQRPDCKDAYADMGLAAVVPLVWDSVTNKGCKW